MTVVIGMVRTGFAQINLREKKEWFTVMQHNIRSRILTSVVTIFLFVITVLLLQELLHIELSFMKKGLYVFLPIAIVVEVISRKTRKDI